MVKRTFQPLVSLVHASAAQGHGDPDTATRTLIEQTYAQLRDDIIEGRLLPGSKLRIEHLRTQYAVGAGTLREALTRLVSDALASAEGQRGFRVAPITLEGLIALSVEIKMKRSTLHWLAMRASCWVAKKLLRRASAG